MTATLLHLSDWLLWVVLAVSVAYVVFFALISLLPPQLPPNKPKGEDTAVPTLPSFLVLFPAYHEDGVILNSVTSFLQQDYPADRYEVAVISDHIAADVNRQLAALPITLHQPQFEHSSKARALQYAMSKSEGKSFDAVVILDADNVTGTDFLRRLAMLRAEGHRAIQCHRTAKNTDSDVAVLDGVSEEINNTIFRRAHNRAGLSSALIGSGMCFDHAWFARAVHQLSTAGEDRELEALLLKERIFVYYADDLLVMDEKVGSADNFQRQRLRWMSAQVNSLLTMLPYVPRAIVTGNIGYLDKTLQQALVPRSMLLVLTAAIAIVLLPLAPLRSIKWWLLLLLLAAAITIAIPRRLRSRTLLAKAMLLPQLVWRMLCNIGHIDARNKNFIHTQHAQ